MKLFGKNPKRTIITIAAFFLLVAAVFACINFITGSPTPELLGKTPNRTHFQRPLFVVTGLNAERSDITLEELKALYTSGDVYTLPSVRASADSVLGTGNPKSIENVRAFIPIAKTNLLITDLENLESQVKALSINGVSFFGSAETYPLMLSDSSASLFAYDSLITKFTLTGVTAIARNTGKAADANGYRFIIEKVVDEFQTSDLVHVSNEVSFAPGCVYQGGTKFCTKEEHFQAFIDLSVDIVELTGNHNRDYGNDAFRKTFAWYKEHGMKTFGGGLNTEEAAAPLIITLKDGMRIAFIGFNQSCPLGECADGTNTPGANRYNREKAKTVITSLKQNKQADFVFISVQFDEVDAYMPPGTQQKITKDLIDFGADMVYGSQAHQVQCVEFYKGKPIYHGLGNFLFDQIHKEGLRQGFLLHNYFYGGKLVQSVPVYTYISENRRPELATTQQAAAIQKAILLDKFIYTP